MSDTEIWPYFYLLSICDIVGYRLWQSVYSTIQLHNLKGSSAIFIGFIDSLLLVATLIGGDAIPRGRAVPPDVVACGLEHVPEVVDLAHPRPHPPDDVPDPPEDAGEPAEALPDAVPDLPDPLRDASPRPLHPLLDAPPPLPPVPLPPLHTSPLLTIVETEWEGGS